MFTHESKLKDGISKIVRRVLYGENRGIYCILNHQPFSDHSSQSQSTVVNIMVYQDFQDWLPAFYRFLLCSCIDKSHYI